MVCLRTYIKRLSLIAGVLLLGTLVACGGGGSVSVGGSGGDISGGSGAGATPIDTGGDGGDDGELAPTGGGGTPVAVEIPALGDVNNLPFISGVVVNSTSSSLSAQLSTSKSFKPSKSMLPQAAVAAPEGGIILSGAEDFDANDSMTACATAQQWQDIWKKNSQTNDFALCKIKATVQLAEDNAIDPYDEAYHIFEDGTSKTRFRVIRNSSNVIQNLEFSTCDVDVHTGLGTQTSYSLYTISGETITISTKYFTQSLEVAALPTQAGRFNTGNVATLAGTLYAEDPTQYTAKSITNLSTSDMWRDDGAGTYHLETANNSISALVQEPDRVLIDSGSYEYRTVGGVILDTTGLYSSATITNPDGTTFIPANYRMFQGAGTLANADLIRAYYGYTATYIAEPESLTECWNNSMMSIECLNSNANYLAIDGHTPRDISNAMSEAFTASESWDCSGSADIPDDDDLYTSCTEAMYSSFVGSGFSCKEKLKGHALESLLLQANGSSYPANAAPVMTMRLSYGPDGQAFDFTKDYVPDPINEFYSCSEDSCGQTAIGFHTAEGPAFSLNILTQPTGKVCQVSTGNGLYYGPSNELNDVSTNSTYIRCTDCPGGVCPSVTSGEGKTPAKMVMYSSDYGIDGFVGFNAADVRTHADSICRYSSKLPDGCGTPHAFISISSSDTIASMPANFGFSDTLQVVSATNIEIASNWTDIVGGLGVAGLTNNLTDAGVTTTGWWSGSDLNGGLSASSCSGWTSRAAMGTVGAADSVGIFISDVSTSCDKAMHEDYKLLCLCPRLPYTVFVTAVAWSPSGGVSGADTFCNNNKPEGVTGTYKAMLSDGSSRVACTTANCGGASGTSENVNWVFRPYSKYQRADGTGIATTNDKGVFTFPLGTAISATILDLAWTGIDADWTPYAHTCNSWTNSTDGYFGLTGNANSVNAAGDGLDKTLAATLTQCNSSRNLICVEQP